MKERGHSHNQSRLLNQQLGMGVMPLESEQAILGDTRLDSKAHGPHALPCSPGNGSTQAADLRIRRQHSSDSVSSINSATSHSSVGSNIESDSKKKKRKNWVSVHP